MPLMGMCIDCGSALIQTVTRGAVEKYFGIATNMCNQYKINDYLRSRIESIAMELKLIFKEEKRAQSSLIEFMGG
jgi:DNA polymerase II large subunit